MAPRPRFSGESIARAIAQLDHAAQLDPSQLSIHQGRLFLAVASGDYARAVVSLALSLKGYPDASADTWLEYVGSFPTAAATHAVAYTKLLVARYPTEASVHVDHGAWLGAAGRREEARLALQAALAIDQRNAMAHWRLGEVLESLGDNERADQHYSRSLALGGDLSEERTSAYHRFKRSLAAQTTRAPSKSSAVSSAEPPRMSGLGPRESKSSSVCRTPSGPAPSTQTVAGEQTIRTDCPKRR